MFSDYGWNATPLSTHYLTCNLPITQHHMPNSTEDLDKNDNV